MTTPPRLLRALALALPALLAVGCNDDDNGGGPDVTLLVEAVVSGLGGTVVVTDGGVGVTAVDVTLNGTAATTGAVDGEYNVFLAPPVATGGALTLDVDDGTAIVQGTGTVPEAPVITAPLTGADVAVGADVEVTWTSTADPDGWLVLANSGGTIVTAESADGALRALTLGGASLSAGDWVVIVFAVNDGLITGDTETGSTMAIRSGAETTPAFSVVPPVLVVGSDMGGEFNHVGIVQGGTSVDGATVTVNGEAALQGAPGDEYHVQLAAPVAVGGALVLDIAFGGLVIGGSGTVPEAPVATAPADGASFAAATAIQVDWTSTADPDRFAVIVEGPTLFQNLEIAGNLRTFTIPGGTFTAGAYTISVFAYNDGTFTGPVQVDSRMSIRGEQGPFPDITINP